jgi:hypothetical protein
MVASLVCAKCGKSLKQLVESKTPEQLVECIDTSLFTLAQLRPEFSPKMAIESSESTMMEGQSVAPAKTL